MTTCTIYSILYLNDNSAKLLTFFLLHKHYQ